MTLALATLNAILTSTLPSTTTTEEPSYFGYFGENGLNLLIIATALTLILLMILCCVCASHPSGGNGSSTRRHQSVLPTTAAPPQTTVTQTKQSTIYKNQTGQPFLKTYKVLTHSTSSGESIHSMQSSQNHQLLPAPSTTAAAANYRSKQNQYHQNTNPFYDIQLDTVSAPRKLTPDYYTRQGINQY
uniref:Uncharacterized protein n=1 Tax=Panagrolaimus davidi TaxID=227884 RepID=A0A914QJA6_9BILA